MSVIIRLQNLPWSANALDIRQYFHGLSIPEGGVHIVGGEQGDAFIAFRYIKGNVHRYQLHPTYFLLYVFITHFTYYYFVFLYKTF